MISFEQLTHWRPTRPTYGVIGYPIKHSLSPIMQQAAMHALGLDADYLAFEIPPDQLIPSLEHLEKIGVKGINLTLPHKTQVLPWLHETSNEVKAIGAANTIKFDAGLRKGYNTDAPGFSRAIETVFKKKLRELRILLLGAGGAGRAIAFQAISEKCQKLVIVNRTIEKAEQLIKELSSSASTFKNSNVTYLTFSSSDQLTKELANSDLIVNTTSLGLRENDPSLIPRDWFQPNHLLFDTIYQPSVTSLMREAQSAGAQTANGLFMLLYQGALAFEIWFSQPAPIDVMKQALFQTQI
ncbi:MAG: shikimate dehydrogenase [Verrucomicrobiae bacterium]|nr:shikimate dehydrogenase [Verrucomicrobiae bacterium]